MSVLSVRLDAELEKQIHFVMQQLKLQDKSALIRQLLSESLEEKIIDIACNCVRKGEISSWKAAQLVGVSLSRMLDELFRRNIAVYDKQSFWEDMKTLGIEI